MGKNMGKKTICYIEKRNTVFRRRNCQRALVLLMAVVVLLGISSFHTEAAMVKLNKSKITIYVGNSTTLKFKGISKQKEVLKKVRWSSSDNSVVTIKTGAGKPEKSCGAKGYLVSLTGKKAGKAVITAKAGDREYSCKVIVKRPQLSCKEKTLRVGKSFSLKMKGATVKEWTSSDESIVVVNKKGRVTAMQAGKGVITCRTKDERFYPCFVTVKKSKAHVHKYISEITTAPTCHSEGVETYICSCGDSYSKNIGATNKHNYETIVTQPKCSYYGYTTYYCKDCGYSYQSDFLLPLGHDMEEKVIHEVDEEHCYEFDKTYNVCKQCGYMEFLGGVGIEKHTFTSIVVPPTDTEQGYTLDICNVCGVERKRDDTEVAE